TARAVPAPPCRRTPRPAVATPVAEPSRNRWSRERRRAPCCRSSWPSPHGRPVSAGRDDDGSDKDSDQRDEYRIVQDDPLGMDVAPESGDVPAEAIQTEDDEKHGRR